MPTRPSLRRRLAALMAGLSALCAATLVGGCASFPPTGGTGWDAVLGTSWVVSELGSAAPIEGTTLEIEFVVSDPGAPARLTGKAVNQFSGECTRDGAALSFGLIASTRMFDDSPSGSMEQEGKLFVHLADVTGWRLEHAGGTRLYLTSDDETELVLIPASDA